MARSIAQALKLTRPATTVAASSTGKNARLLVASRSESTQAERNAGSEEEAEALAVQRIEDAIHRIIVKRSAPDWLPFYPGASYWVPPRRSSYGVADLVQKLANTLSEEEIMSLATFRGWPSSNFYLDKEKGSMPKKEKQSEDEEA
ncbi:hypothetical protein P3S67_010052 [Capsicum chacoense]|uniref:uncharacterized protein LOC107855863 n=1 Tax=Capsicum annuum TaxID=4072 RepID=UPI001FB0920E|nr:uncharacterized protein LOC107855863 [Capsicum annuum]KAF3634738.1 putative V-type proton ATPase catalytic subunit A-like [Capsicum annuum]